jgi:hypothetical protein
MENEGTKHGHITWPKHISTIRKLLAEGSIQCIVQQSNHLSIKNETMSTTVLTAVCYNTVLTFTITVGSSIMSINMLFYSLIISK